MIIGIFCFLCGVGLVVLGHFTFNSLTFVTPMDIFAYVNALFLFVGAFFIGMIISFFLYWIIALPISPAKERKKPSKFYRFLFMQGLDFICFITQVRCRFKGKDFLPKGRRFVLVCNHRSNFDPMLITKKIGRFDIAFVSKMSNFKIPMVGRMITALCFMAVDRSDPLQSLTIVKRCQNYVENNICSIGVFPEGKRYTGEGLGEFHEGFFNVAIKSNVPLVVCTVKGTEKISKRAPWRPTKTKIEVIRVFEPEEIAGMPAKQVSDIVRQLMIDNINEPSK